MHGSRLENRDQLCQRAHRDYNLKGRNTAMRRLLLAAACSMLGASLSGCIMVRETTTGAAAPAASAAPQPAAPTPLVQRDQLAAVGIGVSDLQRSADFYINVMGMKQVATYKISYMDEIVVGYPEAESYIVLMHWTDGSARNYKNLPIKIVARTKDPAALAGRIRAAGFEVMREPAPSEEVGGAVVGFARDPDGYVLELLPLRQPAR